ncbi:hypothetical protein DIS14_08325 [Leuconostoc pseudomesenteroides]|nr:hypothetical protein DIS14_08325 [Leuconostoc pseudomesenteroides]
MEDNNYITDFAKSLSYFEQINLLITIFQSENQISRKEAYERALVQVADEKFIEYKLKQIIQMGPIT